MEDASLAKENSDGEDEEEEEQEAPGEWVLSAARRRGAVPLPLL